MDTTTVNTTTPAVELASPQEVTVDPFNKIFTEYIQSYLIRRGLNEPFIMENITAEVILDSLRENQDTTLGPARSLGPTWEHKNSDRVCTGHLQRFLIKNGFKPEFVKQVTGPHIMDSIIDVMPEDLLPKTPTNQAASAAVSTAKAPRKDSAVAANSVVSDDDYDEDEDMPTKHRRTSRAKYLKDYHRGRITKRSKKKTRPTLDLSKNYHKIETACLATLELSEDSTFNLNVSSIEYADFLRDCSSFLAIRLAAISVTLARSEEKKKAVDFGQFGLDLVGPAFFNAALALCEGSEEERESMKYSKIIVPECFDEISAQWDIGLARELAALAKGHGMWSV